MDGSGILLVHVPEQKDKPVYLRGMTIYDSYYRSAGQTHKMSKAQVHAMLATAEGQTFEDRIALPGLTAEKVITLLDFAQFYKLIHKSVPSGIDISLREWKHMDSAEKKTERGSLPTLELYLWQETSKISRPLPSKM